MTKLDDIKAYLLELADGAEPMYKNQGICINLVGKFNVQIKYEMFKRWPECHFDPYYGIDYKFPVGGQYEDNSKDKWSGDRSDHPKRRRLCKWMAENITKGDFS